MINIFETLFKKKADSIFVYIDVSRPVLVVRLLVNDRQIAQIQCVMESTTEILIGDIKHYNGKVNYNKGYGSMMMDKLLSYARENDIYYIYGNLSYVDLDHKERLHHFYKKFGFTIIEYDKSGGCYYGKIELRL